MKIKVVIVSAVLILMSGFVSAASLRILNAPIEIDMERGYAQGALKTARFSEDEKSSIGCGTNSIVARTQIFPGGPVQFPDHAWGYCQALTSNMDGLPCTPDFSCIPGRVFCFTEDPLLLSEINSQSDFAFVSFTWTKEGTCLHVGNNTISNGLPSNKDEEKAVKKENKIED